MWVRFKGAFDFYPAARKGAVAIAYKPGMVMNVTRECAEQAISQGKATRSAAKGRHGQGNKRR